MKKTSLLLALSLLTSGSLWAQTTAQIGQLKKVNAAELKASLSPDDVAFLATPERVEGLFTTPRTPQQARPQVKKQLPRRDAAAVDTVGYYAVAQSFHKDYQFNFNGGAVYSYPIGLALDGTKATLTNLFDMYNQSATAEARSHDYPVEGVYDADAKTITIPTTKQGIVCGTLGGYYDLMLIAGEVTEGGQINPAEELVFDVTTDNHGRIRTLTARQNFLARYDYGTARVYKSFTANLPVADEANIITLDESVDYGEAFVRTSTTRDITLYNTGGMDAEYALELEADDDVFTTTTVAGTIPAQSAFTIPVEYKPLRAGDYEGLVTLTYDSGRGEKSLVFDLSGSAKDYPDYSAAIKSGQYDITTGQEFPFEMTTLEDGTAVAQSGTHGAYGTSWLNLEFDVPQGKLATVSWKGLFNNSSNWYQNAGGYFVDTLDGAKIALSGQNEDFSGSYEFAPGHHFIRYQFEGLAYTGLDANRLYVYDIAYKEQALAKDSAVLVTPEVNLGNDVLQAGGTSTLQGTISLKNAGQNDLRVISVKSDNAAFTTDLSGLTAAKTLEEIAIPVTLETRETGDPSATLTIETSAGTFTATVKAHIIAMPDFQSLVSEGAEYITGWEVNKEAPFIIRNGKAVNANAGDNSVNEKAWVKMNLSVPEGKLAYVSWEGRAYGRPEDNVNYTHYYSSYFTIGMEHPMNGGTFNVYGSDVDAGSTAVEANEFWSSLLACIPGDHSYQWGWMHNGDGEAPEGDYVEISNIKIHVIDYKENNVEVVNPDIEFNPCYVGPQRYQTAKVTLKNTGSKDLTVGTITSDAPFYGIETTDIAQFDKTLDVTLWFYPSEKGDFTGTVTLKTSAGPVQVNCHGVAKDAADEGYIYFGDFEDNAYGWTIVDRDADGETWNLGSNLWGDRPEYCHSGSQCLASVSYSNNLGSVTPDNWTISPVITIPDDGAMLTYYVAAFHPDRYQEHYSLYVTPYTEDQYDIEDVVNTTPLQEETLQEENGAMNGWTLRTVDLKDFAGQQVVLAFRHHDCTGQYILRLDDVNVMTRSGYNAVQGTQRTLAPQQTAYFTLDGQRVNGLQRGITIVRTVDAEGRTEVHKVIR